MNEITIKKRSVKKNSLLLTFFVLFSLFISENVFARKLWQRDDVVVEWQAHSNLVLIRSKVYNYSFRPDSKHGYLRWCKFECSKDKENYKILMEFFTERQSYSNKTTVALVNKLKNTQIEFLQNVGILSAGAMWLESRPRLDISVLNSHNLASLSLGWHLGEDFKDFRYIRVIGIWNIDPPYELDNISEVYKINIPGKSVLKSNAPGINTKVTKNDTVKVFNKSASIVVKGADSGSNIKVYNTSGGEIKSVISNNDVVKINLPAKQIYIRHYID